MKTTIQSRVSLVFSSFGSLPRCSQGLAAPLPARAQFGGGTIVWIPACMRDSSRSFSRKLRPSRTSLRNFST